MKELQYPFDEKLILRKRNHLLSVLRQQCVCEREIKIAVLSDSTSELIVQLLELFLLNEGIRAIFFHGSHGAGLQQNRYLPQDLHAFQPEFIYFHVGIRDLWLCGDTPMPEDEFSDRVERQLQKMCSLWDAVSLCNAQIIQNNYELPSVRNRGNYDGVGEWGQTRFISRLNESLHDAANNVPGLHILDVNYLSAFYGLSRWASPKTWYEAKIWPSLEASVYLAYSLSRMIASMVFGSKKLIITDFDNTIWAGTIADVGVDRINMAPETASGEAHRELQQWMLQMKESGILLAAATKNDLDDALAGLNRSDCLLSPDDFIQIEANWGGKDESVRKICRQLNLLPQSVVFLDDSETERILVERNVPGVIAIPFSHVETALPVISAAQLFQIETVSGEDLRRTQMYHDYKKQAETQRQFETYELFLQNLQLSLEILPVKQEILPRMVQLLRKTNRFRLNSAFFSEQRLLEMLSQENYWLQSISLRDRTMDYGAISFVIAQKRDGCLSVLQWVLSCRAFQKGVEYAIIDRVVSFCKDEGLNQLVVCYEDMEKNGIVQEVLKKCGFSPSNENAESWILTVSNYTPQAYYIDIKELR